MTTVSILNYNRADDRVYHHSCVVSRPGAEDRYQLGLSLSFVEDRRNHEVKILNPLIQSSHIMNQQPRARRRGVLVSSHLRLFSHSHLRSFIHSHANRPRQPCA